MQVPGTDWELVEQYRAGDERAFTALVQRHTPAMRRHFSKFFHRLDAETRRVTVEDLTQDLWFRVHRNIDRLDITNKFTAWLYRVATNLALNEQRNARRDRMCRWPVAQHPETGEWQEVEFADPRLESRPDLLLEHKDLAQFVARQLEHLPADQLEILQMRDDGGDGNRYGEIAERLGVPVGTVKSRLSRARSTLRLLRGENGGDS